MSEKKCLPSFIAKNSFCVSLRQSVLTLTDRDREGDTHVDDTLHRDSVCHSHFLMRIVMTVTGETEGVSYKLTLADWAALTLNEFRVRAVCWRTLVCLADDFPML